MCRVPFHPRSQPNISVAGIISHWYKTPFEPGSWNRHRHDLWDCYPAQACCTFWGDPFQCFSECRIASCHLVPFEIKRRSTWLNIFVSGRSIIAKSQLLKSQLWALSYEWISGLGISLTIHYSLFTYLIYIFSKCHQSSPPLHPGINPHLSSNAGARSQQPRQQLGNMRETLISCRFPKLYFLTSAATDSCIFLYPIT